MKERPILFSGPMVRALLDGRKTQTRRIVKFPLIDKNMGCELAGCELAGSQEDSRANCPYGHPRQRLWVKETHSKILTSANPKVDYVVFPGAVGGGQQWSDGQFFPAPLGEYAKGAFDRIKWRPSIFMFRRHSRLLLEIVDVRVERLQNITDEDAKAEGIDFFDDFMGNDYSGKQYKNYLFETSSPKRGTKTTDDANRILGFKSPVDSYRTLWDSINGPGSWALNPWVWVLQFKRL